MKCWHQDMYIYYTCNMHSGRLIQHVSCIQDFVHDIFSRAICGLLSWALAAAESLDAFVFADPWGHSPNQRENNWRKRWFWRWNKIMVQGLCCNPLLTHCNLAKARSKSLNSNAIPKDHLALGAAWPECTFWNDPSDALRPTARCNTWVVKTVICILLALRRSGRRLSLAAWGMRRSRAKKIGGAESRQSGWVGRCPQVGAFIDKAMLPQPEAAKIICRVNGCLGWAGLVTAWTVYNFLVFLIRYIYIRHLMA